MRTRKDDDERLPLSPRALGAGIALWILVMLVLALVVVPLLFSQCAPPPLEP